METTVEGEGWLRFWWKAACEDDSDGTGWDRLSFFVDGGHATGVHYEKCAQATPL